MMAAADRGPPRIPAGLLYWGCLPVSYRRAREAVQDFACERFVPVPVESLHLTRACAANGETILVGIEEERLRAFLATDPERFRDSWSLLPDRLPEGIRPASGDDAVCDRLNLLHGRFEPAARRRWRRATTALLHGGLAAACLLLLLGVERRAQAGQERTRAIAAASQAAIAQAVQALPGDRHPAQRLTMELRRMEQAQRLPRREDLQPGQIQEGLWRHWPADIRLQAETVSVVADRVVIRGRVPSLADAERLAQAFASIEVRGQVFRAEPLQAQQQPGRGASFLLTLVRRAAPAGGPR